MINAMSNWKDVVFSSFTYIVLVTSVCRGQTTYVCQGELSTNLQANDTTSNQIDSFNYPNEYSNNGACYIRIFAAAPYVIKLTIESYVKRIEVDTFKIFDGRSTSDKRLVEKEKLQAGKSFKSTGQYVYIRHDDSGTRNNAFRVSYMAISEIPACSSTVTTYSADSTQKSFYSHSAYPSNYPNNYDNYWLIIKSKETDELVYYFEEFRTEKDRKGCKQYDRLLVYNGACTTDTIEERHCGTEDSSLHYVRGGKYILFRMVTDGSFTDKGFHVKYYTRAPNNENVSTNTITEKENLGWIVVPIIGGAIFLSIIAVWMQKIRDKQENKQITEKERKKRCLWLAGLFLYLAIEISMIVIGSYYYNDCRIQSFIPRYLVGAGSVGIVWYMIITFNERIGQRQGEGFLHLLFIFTFGWFIAGNALIFSASDKWVEEPVTSTKYCHPVLYRYAFAVIILYDAIIGITILLSCAKNKK